MDATKPPSKAARIGVVGGGVSGLTLAHYLKEAGYGHVTLLEKEPRVGGKCCSAEVEGRVYELGAVFGTRDYTTTLELMKAVGMESGPMGGADCYDDQGRQIDLYAWHQIPRLFWLLMVNYTWLTRIRYRRINEPGLDGIPPELCLPFKAFALRHGFPTLGQVLTPPFTAFGYGYFDEVPAAYVLKYLELPMILALRDGRRRLLWPGGIETLWTRLAQRHDVRTGITIRRVVRQDTVRVETADQVLEFDALILACPLDGALSFLDASAAERRLFAAIRYYDYWVLLCEIDGLPPGSGYIPAHFTADKRGHVMLWYRRWPETRLYTLYVLGDFAMAEEEVERTCSADLRRMGATLDRVVTVRRWKYFPHVGAQEMADGYYETLEGLQGANHTYYAGEIMSFTTVELCARYSRSLVERCFSSRRGR